MCETEEKRTVNAAQARGARELLGWSRAKLAVKAGVSPSSINRLERDARRPAAWVEALIVAALESAGVIFVEENGEGPGVRLRKAK
jgi:transcriptional regulator with XRE-family HTH domain